MDLRVSIKELIRKKLFSQNKRLKNKETIFTSYKSIKIIKSTLHQPFDNNEA